MSTIYMSQLSAALPLIEGSDHHHQDHHHQGQFQAFTLPARNPPTLFTFVTSKTSPSDSGVGGGYGSDHHQLISQQQHAMLDHRQPQQMIGGSSSVFAAPPLPTVESIRDDMIERHSSFEPYSMEMLHAAGGSGLVDAGNWSTAAASAPAKMRITRKASDPGVGVPAAKKKSRSKVQQAYEDYNHNGGAMNQAVGVIRTCSDCNTTKTPLWRSGPRGPKSLCNACGIRQRKARRALMSSGEAAVSTSGGPKAAPTPVRQPKAKAKKEKIRVAVDRSLPFKKRCKVVQDHTAANTAAAAATTAVPVKVSAAAPASDLADNMAVKWCKSPTTTADAASAAASCFWTSPPSLAAAQDEITDAAMLLMTLSCPDRPRIGDTICDEPSQAFFLPH